MFLRNKPHWWLLLCVVLFCSFSLLKPASTIQAQSSAFLQFIADMRFLKERSEAVLFFNVFGENPDFTHHRLNKDQIRMICGSDCGEYGANTANYFGNHVEWKFMDDVNFGWVLQIAQQANPGAVSGTINEYGEELDIIVRFGTADDAGGFTTPDSLINYLNQVAASASEPFYAIAGPNEPDHEPWAHDDPTMAAKFGGAACGKYVSGSPTWAECVGPRLADFMTQMCTARQSGRLNPKVQLLTPAFNVTSPSYEPLMEQLTIARAPFECFNGMAINLYPAGKSVEEYWEEKNLDGIGIPIFITETGPWDHIFFRVGDEEANRREMITEEPDRRDDTDSYHYISPLMGLYPKAARNVPEIRDSLANQGYQAYCATPTYTIEQQFSGDIEDFIANVRAGLQAPRDVEVDSTEIVNYNNAKTPIFRATERKAFLKSDMEEFFGYRELDENTYAQTEIESGAINSLLSDTQKCMKTADALVAQRTMCNKLAVSPEDNCALYYTTVPGTDMDILDLFKAYEAYKHEKTDAEACHGIVTGAEGVSEEFRTAMLNAALHIEEAYRIAFLVGVVRQKPEEPSPLFNFFSRTSTVPPPDEVVVLSFKIPDIGTNKGTIWETEEVTNADGEVLYERVQRNDQNTRVEAVESGHTYWDDVMTLTRNILIPRKMAEKMDLEGSQERIKLREAAAAATSQGSGSLIYCLTGQAPYGSGSATCNDEAVKAVVDIINGTWVYDKERVSCDPANLTNEVVNEIGDSARLGGAVDNYKFQFQYGEFILANIWDINSTSQDFQTVFKVNSSNWAPQPCNVLEQGQGAQGDCTTINFYLVYPMGYDLETLEYVMARTFLTEDQYEAAAQNPDIKNRFTVFDDEVRLDAETNEEEFTDYLDCSYEDGRRVCAEKEFEATVVSSQGPALFLGARVGFWIHEIQKSFNRLESLAHKYLRACRTTEEFLLDQCGGAPDDGEFDDAGYCTARPDRAAIIRDVGNDDTNRFRFFRATGEIIQQQPAEIPIDIEDNTFFPQPGEPSCRMSMAVRAVDGLTLILSGGKDIVPNNPGNILGCTGRVSASRKLRIQRLPPEYKADVKAANPDWKPATDDPGWATAEVLRTRGSSASEIQYDISLTRGYYKVELLITNGICQSDMTWVMKDGEEIGEDEYVYDFTSDAGCQAGACYDVNLQPNMEGGGPVYGVEDGETVILYTIDKANEYFKDSFGCELSFDYSTLQYNNTCGGGRMGDCATPGIGGDCGFWDDMIEKIREGRTIGGKRGSDAYYAVFGRYPDASGVMSCVDKDNGDPIFGNTIVIRDCEAYTNSLDSLRIFGKIIGFKIQWFLTQQEVEFQIPSRQIWESIQSASAKHGCDPWLVLALASSEGEEHGYYNDTRPNDAQTIGMFEFLPNIWEDWTRDNNPNDAQCTWRQPSSFNAANKAGLDFSDRANIPAAVDTACRIILYSGMQKYPDDRTKFIAAFTGQYPPEMAKENNYSFGWNNNPLQADYVFEFWQKARTGAEEAPKAQPAGYPYNVCTGGEQPSQPIATPPSGIPTSPPGANNTGAPPTPEQAGTVTTPGTWSVDQWATYMNYFQRTQLPTIGMNTYMARGVIDEVLANRQGSLNEISRDTIHTCTLDYSLGGGDPFRTLESLKAQAANNGRSRAIGCTASVRIGDLPFRGEIGEGKDAFRTVWVKPKNGVFTNTCIGPILIMDVAAQHHLREQYHKFGSNYTLDVGYELFEFIHSGYGAWRTRQEMVVADTEQQCQNTQFGEQ